MAKRFLAWLKSFWRRPSPPDEALDTVPTCEIDYDGHVDEHVYHYPPPWTDHFGMSAGKRVVTSVNASPTWLAEGIKDDDVAGKVGTVVLVGTDTVSLNLGGAWQKTDVGLLEDAVKPYEAGDLMRRLVTSLGMVVAFDESTVTFRHRTGAETTLSYADAMQEAVWIDNTPFGTVIDDLLK